MKREDFISENIKAVENAAQVLKHMNGGNEVNLGGYTCILAETEHGGSQLMYKVGEDEWMGFMSMDLDSFITLCGKLTEEELVIMAANRKAINKR